MEPKSIEYICYNCKTSINDNWWYCPNCKNEVILEEVPQYSLIQNFIIKIKDLFTCMTVVNRDNLDLDTIRPRPIVREYFESYV
jgi:DNA-directed RNA polymerase subunit RPC12/RpoP